MTIAVDTSGLIRPGALTDDVIRLPAIRQVILQFVRPDDVVRTIRVLKEKNISSIG